MIRTIHLPPQLSELCNGETQVKLNAHNFSQIISGLTVMFGPQVKQFVTTNLWQIQFDDDTDLVDEQNVHNLLDTQDIYMFLYVGGASKAAKIIVGVILIVVGSYFGIQPLVQLGISLILSALTMPELHNPSSTEKSLNFDTAVNVIEGQGIAVPVVYGRFKVGSIVSSSGIYAERMGQFSTPEYTNPAPNNAWDEIR